jgi:hypothetical protein
MAGTKSRNKAVTETETGVGARTRTGGRARSNSNASTDMNFSINSDISTDSDISVDIDDAIAQIQALDPKNNKALKALLEKNEGALRKLLNDSLVEEIHHIENTKLSPTKQRSDFPGTKSTNVDIMCGNGQMKHGIQFDEEEEKKVARYNMEFMKACEERLKQTRNPSERACLRWSMCNPILSKRDIYNTGCHEGIDIGEKQGIDIGEKQGIKIGEKQGIEKVIRSIHQKGVPVKSIARMTGFSDDFIRQLIH